MCSLSRQVWYPNSSYELGRILCNVANLIYVVDVEKRFVSIDHLIIPWDFLFMCRNAVINRGSSKI